MGLFYPSDEMMLGQIDYILQTIMNIIIMSGLCVFFFVNNNYASIKTLAAQPLILVALFGIAATAICSVDKEQSAKFILAVATLTLPSIIYLQKYGHEKTILSLSWFVMTAAFFNLFYVIAFPQYGIMTGKHAGMWRGLFEHKNGAGAFFAIGFYILLFRTLRMKSLNSIIYVSAMSVCLLFIILGHSATGGTLWIAGGILFGGYYLILRLVEGKDRTAFILSVIALLLVLCALFGENLLNKFFAFSGKDATLTGRTGLWNILLDLSLEKPLTGWGPGMAERPDFMQRIQGDVGWDAKGTHNSYLDVVIGCGYPVSILMLLVILKVFFRSLNLRLRTKSEHLVTVTTLTVLTLILILSGFGSGALYSRSIFWIFAVTAMSVLSSLNKRSESKLSTD